MNKKLAILIVSLLVLSGCTKPKMVLDKVVDKVEQKKDSAKQSIKDLLASGTSQKCVWSVDEEGSKSEGEMWVSGKKFRQDIKTTVGEEKKETKMTVVSDGKYTYIWNSDMGNKGIKMEIKDDESQDYTTESGKVDLNEQYQFECKPGMVSDKDLTPPAEIEFQDLGAQLQDIQKLQEKFGQAPNGDGE